MTSPLGRSARLGSPLGYTTYAPLRDGRLRLFGEWATAADVYDAIGLLREGVTRRGSRFKIEGIGPYRYGEILDWLEACGYPIEGLRLPARAKAEPR